MNESENTNAGESEQFGKIYSALYFFLVSRSRNQRKAYQKIVSDVVRQNPGSVLDIDCGPGIAISMIAKKLPETEAFCVDPSPAMIKIARNRFKKLGLEKRVISDVIGSSRLGFDREFDIVFTSLSFHHWADPVSSLKSILLKLKEGGQMFIYENLIGDSMKVNNKHPGHGISRQFADSLNFDGFEKSIELTDKNIIVRFKRSGQSA